MKKEEFTRYRKQAEHNLESAHRDCEQADYDWACFKSHQAAEMIVKGWIRSSDHFVTGHSILKLLNEIREKYPVSVELLTCAGELDKVYIPSRYPDAFGDGSPVDFFSKENAEKSIDCAQRIIQFAIDYVDESPE